MSQVGQVGITRYVTSVARSSRIQQEGITVTIVAGSHDLDLAVRQMVNFVISVTRSSYAAQRLGKNA